MTIDEYKAYLAKSTKKNNKYRNKRIKIDDIDFQSIAEGTYYGKLKILKKSGIIKDFRMQVRYDFIINGILVCFYKSDFDVVHHDDSIDVCDVKGVFTAIFRIKQKLMLACYGIKIKIIK